MPTNRGMVIMLRIHFTPDDVGRLRFALEPQIAWELSASVQLLPSAEGGLVFDGWRRRVRVWVDARGVDPAEGRRRRRTIHVLSALYPHKSYFPDFLTPDGVAGRTESLIDAILSTSRAIRRDELSLLARMTPVPSWFGRFVAGDRATEGSIADALGFYRSALLEPVWHQVSGRVLDYRSALTRALLTGGAEEALRSLGPSVRWRPPVLEAVYPVDRDLYLEGRGLEIIPSFFTWRMPVTMRNPDLRPRLVVPIDRRPGDPWLDARGTDPTATIGRLLGRTRASILECALGGTTSTQMRRCAGLSASTLSHHLSVLRESGLIVSRRDRAHLVYEVTDLARDLLSRIV